MSFVYCELLQSVVSVTVDGYSLQRIHLRCAMREKRPKYEQRHDKGILLHENARPYISKRVKILGDTQVGCFTGHAVFS